MTTASPNPPRSFSSGVDTTAGKQERLQAAFAKFQARIADIRGSRLETLKKIFRRVDENRLKAAREQIQQQ